MKNLLPIAFLALLFTACKSNENDAESTRQIRLISDSTVFTNNNVFSDTLATVSSPAVATEKPQAVAKPRAPKKYVAVPQPAVKNNPVYSETPKQETKIPEVIAPEPPVVATAPEPSTSAGTGDNTALPQPVPEKKKGWNKATQGAVIGGAVGAVGGAIISKKKGLGAVIGGIAGAAGGYVIGKNKDKKSN